MSKTFVRSAASRPARRSYSRVAKPARCGGAARKALHGLWRLELLPCTNNTIPCGVAAGRPSNALPRCEERSARTLWLSLAVIVGVPFEYLGQLCGSSH